MRVISKKALRAFWKRHPDSEGALRTWYATAKTAQWRKPQDVKMDYPSADPVGNNRIVFDICNNRYRLVARILYQFGQVHVRFVGTHGDYDNIDASTI
jgi:mRNA interferase HigB